MKFKKILGIDVGGSGIKGAVVDLKKGALITERHRIETPQPATPDSVGRTIQQIIHHFEWKGPVGVGFPAVIQGGVVKTAANVDSSWIGLNANNFLSKLTGLPVYLVNDADAAGMAEMKYGVGQDMKGTVLLLTIGTGIGSVLFTKGKLVPNTEIGHIMLNGKDAEQYTSDAARKRENLSWEDWAKRFNEYLKYIENLLWPELIIIGGGVSKKEDRYKNFIHINSPIVPAMLQNNAGIVGAAATARSFYKSEV